MRKYRYYFLIGFVLSTIGFYLLYDFNILSEKHFLWPTAICTPLFTLTILTIFDFGAYKKENPYNEERSKAVQKSAATPLKILQSPIVWLAIISLLVIFWVFSNQ